MSILNVNTIQPIGSGTTVTVAATELKTSNFITVGTGASVTSPSANVLTLGTNSAERLRITSAGIVRIPDNGKIACGASDDLEIYHDGTHSYVKNATGNLYFQHGNENMLQLTSDGNVELYYDNSKKFETHSSGVVISGNLQLNDSNLAYFGDSQDLSIYHNGSQNLIISATGQVLETRADTFQVTNSGGTENLLQANGDGAVNLYYNGTKKFETTLSGVAIHEDTDKVVRFTGSIGEIGNVTGFQASNTAGNALTDLGMRATTLRFATGSAERLRIDSSGHVLPGANNTYDLGSTAKGWRNVYMNDLNLSNMNGDTNDVDGTQGSWTIQEGKDNLYIINRLNGKKFKIKMEEIS